MSTHPQVQPLINSDFRAMNTNAATNDTHIVPPGTHPTINHPPNAIKHGCPRQAGVLREPNANTEDSGRIPMPANSNANSCAQHDVIPRAISLMRFSQDLSSKVFDVATDTIFKHSAAFGGLNPHLKELIRSAPTMGPNSYEDVLAKLQSLENRLVQEAIQRMGPNGLLDCQEFQKTITHSLEASRDYQTLQSELLKMRALRSRTQAIMEAAQSFGSSQCLTQNGARPHGQSLSESQSTLAPPPDLSGQPVLMRPPTQAQQLDLSGQSIAASQAIPECQPTLPPHPDSPGQPSPECLPSKPTQTPNSGVLNPEDRSSQNPKSHSQKELLPEAQPLNQANRCSNPPHIKEETQSPVMPFYSAREPSCSLDPQPFSPVWHHCDPERLVSPSVSTPASRSSSRVVPPSSSSSSGPPSSENLTYLSEWDGLLSASEANGSNASVVAQPLRGGMFSVSESGLHQPPPINASERCSVSPHRPSDLSALSESCAKPVFGTGTDQLGSPAVSISHMIPSPSGIRRPRASFSRASSSLGSLDSDIISSALRTSNLKRRASSGDVPAGASHKRFKL